MISMGFSSSLFAMSEVVSQVTIQLTGLNSKLITLNEQIGRLVASVPSTNSLISLRSDINTGVKKKEGVVMVSAKDHTVKDAIAVAKGLSGMANSSLKVYEAFDKLSPAMEKVKKTVGIVKGVADLANGIEVATRAAGIVDALTAVSSIVGGGVDIAAILAGLTTGGLVAGGLLLAGAITAIVMKDIQAGKPGSLTFAEVAAQNGNPYADQQTTQPLASEYVRAAQHPHKKSEVQTALEANALSERLLKQGGDISFDWRRGEKGDPVYINGLVTAMGKNKNTDQRSIKHLVFDDKRDMEEFRSLYDWAGRFPLVSRPEIVETFIVDGWDDIGARKPTAKASISRKEYEKRQEPQRLRGVMDILDETIQQQAMKSYLDGQLNYVQGTFNWWVDQHKNIPGFKDYAKSYETRFMRAKEIADKDKINRTSSMGGAAVQSPANSTRGKVINININRSLIGNFSIQTADTRLGINRLKHEVETALLEVLNAANSMK